MQNYIFLIITIFCNVGAQIALKYASANSLFNEGLSFTTLINLIKTPTVWLGMILYFVSFIFTIKVYEVFKLNEAIPLFIGSTFMLSILSSAILFSELINWQKLLGITIIFIGILIVVYSASLKA